MFFCPSLKAQTDTAFKRSFSLAISPTLMLAGNEELLTEYRPNNMVMLCAGGGLSFELSNGTPQFGTSQIAYTLRGGILTPTGKSRKNYFGVVAFFRQWRLRNEINNDSTGNYMNSTDFIINPSALFVGGYPDNERLYDFNGTVNVICLDVQDVVNLVYDKHFLFQLYGGAGWRWKSISLARVGYFSNSTNTNLNLTPQQTIFAQSYGFLDIKLGFMLGYTF